MLDILISFVSGSAFLGGMAAIVFLVMLFRQPPGPRQYEIEIRDLLKHRNTLNAQIAVALQAIVLAINQHNPKRQELIGNDVCPECCGGSLDTGYECIKCGFDAQPELLPRG